MTLFSVGHSTLTADKFVYLLRRHDVEVLMDVRSHPTSRWPQFHRVSMQQYLPEAGIRYEFEPQLGGWAGRHRDWVPMMDKFGVNLRPYLGGHFPKQAIVGERVASEDKPIITNQGLWAYSYFLALPEAFHATAMLLERGRTENIAICCAEGAWFRCHRSMIADFLVWLGSDIRHIAGRKFHSEVIGDRLERYDPPVIEAWKQGGLLLENPT